MSNAADWRCAECGYELEDANHECPICTPKERREKRLKELWELIRYICGKSRMGFTGPLCEHPNRDLRTGNTCDRTNCPALPQAEKVLEIFARDIR